jgi:PAS domain S-box-containing protein
MNRSIHQKGPLNMQADKNAWCFDLEDYLKVFEISTELICIADPMGKLVKINPALEKALGYTSEEILKVGLEKLVHPDDLPKTHSFLSELSKGKKIPDLEIRCLSKSGEAIWLLWNVSRIHRRNLNYCVARDISASKKKEKEKEESDRLLKHTVNSLPVLVAYIDLDFQYRFMNAIYESWVGAYAESVKSGDLEKVMEAGSAEMLREHRLKAKQTGLPNHCEITFRDKNGEKRFLEVQYHPHRNSSGQVEGIMVLGIDRTELKMAVQSIQNTQNKFQTVLSDGKIGFWEYDFKSQVISVSDNIRQRMGIPAGVALSQEMLQNLIHPDDRKLHLDAQKKVFLERTPYEIEFRIRGHDGEYRWTVGKGHPNLNEAGVLIGLMGISIDVTGRKQMEETLQIQHARMMTSSRLSAIGEMAGGVAHEINNPLTIILSNAQKIKVHALRGDLDAQMIEKTTDKIETTVMRIAKIIQSLRSLSRDSENDPFEPVSLNKVIEDTLEICSERFRNHQVSLKVQIPTVGITLNLRPTQISQVLLNLLNNAHDAVEKLQTREVEVSVLDLGAGVEIAVTDSGNGVPENLHEKIFDPFFTTKEPTKGTGLGLSVSKSLILSHGGTLQFNPQSKKTQFLIYLPKNLKNSSV